MQIGPEYIFKCPKCDNLCRQGYLIKNIRNPFDEKLFSDELSYVPCLSNFPHLTICRNCGVFLDLREIEVGVAKYDSYRGEYNDIEWENPDLKMKYLQLNIEEIPFSIPLERNDLYTALEMFPQGELNFRQQIWRSFNDLLRVSVGYLPISEAEFKRRVPEKLFEENCYALLKLLDPNNEEQKVMMAELFRNVGQFDKCMELIDTLPDHSEKMGNFYSRLNIKLIYKIECGKGNRLLFRVDNYAERLERQSKEEAARREEVRIWENRWNSHR